MTKWPEPDENKIIEDVRTEVRENRLAPHRAMDELNRRWRERMIFEVEKTLEDPVWGRTKLELWRA